METRDREARIVDLCPTPAETPKKGDKPVSQQFVNYRWRLARTMWDYAAEVGLIASLYGVTSRAMKTRIQKMRRERGWFPSRDVPIVYQVTADPEDTPQSRGYFALRVPAIFAEIWERQGTFRDFTIVDGAAAVDATHLEGAEFRMCMQYRSSFWTVIAQCEDFS